MSNKRTNVFSGAPKREGFENFAFKLLFLVGITLGLIKVAVINGVKIDFLNHVNLDAIGLWVRAVQCWNNDSPEFRGMASDLMKVDLLGIVVSIIISLVSVKNSSLKIWSDSQEVRMLFVASIVLMIAMLSDYISVIFCEDVVKYNVNMIDLFVHNMTLGLLLKTYIVIVAGYYVPSFIRMMIKRIVNK